MGFSTQPNRWQCGPFALKHALIMLGILADERAIGPFVAGIEELAKRLAGEVGVGGFDIIGDREADLLLLRRDLGGKRRQPRADRHEHLGAGQIGAIGVDVFFVISGVGQAVAGFVVARRNKDIVTVQTGRVAKQDLASIVTASGEVKPKTYVNIGANAFFDSTLTSIPLPSAVTNIGAAAP